MFWDSVAGVYDLFVNVVNRKTHLALRKIVLPHLACLNPPLLRCR